MNTSPRCIDFLDIEEQQHYMEIRYRNTLDQLLALQKFVLRNSHIGKRMMLHRFLAAEAIILFITVIFTINHNLFKVLIGFAILTGLAWVLRERSVILQFKKDFKRERRKNEAGLFDKNRILSIAPEGLTVRIGNDQTHYTWYRIETVGRDRKHIYLVLDSVLHYVIPISAFSDESEADTFLETIESYRKSGADAQPATDPY